MYIATTPSDHATSHLLAKIPGGVTEVVACAAFRTLFIAPGLYVAGIRGRQLFYGSIAASVGISLFSVAWALIRR